jgi:hypothetical protein
VAEGKEAGVGRQGGQTAGWPQSFAGESFAPGAGLLRIATDPLPYSLLAGMGSVQAVPPAGSPRRTATQLERCDHSAAGNLGVAAGEPSPRRSRGFRSPQGAAAAIASWRCPSALGWWASSLRSRTVRQQGEPARQVLRRLHQKTMRIVHRCAVWSTESALHLPLVRCRTTQAEAK